MSLYDVANQLYRAMWRQDLTSRLQDVDGCEGFKYLPATVVDDLGLRELGFNASVMLVREEYRFTLDTLEQRQENSGGIVVTGHPGIGKSVFIYYTLLHLLGKGHPVALQCDESVVIFREDGVKIRDADSNGLLPRIAFQGASQRGQAWFVLATFLPEKRYDRLCKERNAGVFVMDYFTREESRALSIIRGLDAERFIENYDKWGPSVCTCLRLARGTITEEQLKIKVDILARRFAENPRAIIMEAKSEEDSHWLFTYVPRPKRDISDLRVATPYLRGFIVEAIAKISAASQVSFYAEASYHPSFRSAFGYVFETLFYLWFSSDWYNEISCTAWPRSAEPTRTTRSTKTKSTTRELVELRHLRPVGLDKVIVHGGEAGATGYKSANEHQTPFGWIPASRSDATFDAVICTDTHIITIQVITAAAKPSIKAKGFESLIKNLPSDFQKDRSWCHVFVTDRNDAAAKLGNNIYLVPDKMKVLIHTAVLNISHVYYRPEVLKRAMVPSGDMTGMEIDAEGE